MILFFSYGISNRWLLAPWCETMTLKKNKKKPTIVTTSWDDGHPLDIRLARLLRSYNLAGTFYVPMKCYDRAVMSRKQIRTIHQMRMEIGSHTHSHSNLLKLQERELLKEMRLSKRILEDMIEEPVLSFCYPLGKFNRAVRTCAIEAGYKIIRTIKSFRTEISFDKFDMPVCFQFFYHPHKVHLWREMKEKNLKGIMKWFLLWNAETDLIKLSNLMFNHVLKFGGIFHIWGHSWEIDKFGLWSNLEDVLRLISNRPGVKYLTNSQILDVLS